MILEQIYHNFTEDTAEGERSRALLCQTHWFSSIAELDPRTAEALPQTLCSVLRKISSDPADASGKLKDRLWRITEHVRSSLEKLFHELNESPRREHAILPIRAVRELDTTSFMAVARRPGRNIREKLAEKPYMLAVRRVQSVDLPENRLLKAFAEQLVGFLELRAECLGEEPDELLEIIHSWLQSDEAQSISYWDNVPPNNTLLTHRDYRAVYDAWCWLQALDDDLKIDRDRLDQRQKTMEQWQHYGQMYAGGKRVFAEMPVLFDYDYFEIRPWTGEVLTAAAARSPVSPEGLDIVNTPVCVDLTDLHPAYALAADGAGSGSRFAKKKLPFPFLWQSWKNPAVLPGTVDIDLFKADVLYQHPDAVTVSAPDLFFSHERKDEFLDHAARAFVSKLRETFVDENIVWLLPDYLNDFELTITRRNINTAYPGAQPLPRSVAAVSEKVDYKQLTHGFSVVVLDSIGGIDCAIRLEAKLDSKLKKCLPETCGFYWERQPPVILSGKDDDGQDKTRIGYDITTLDGQGKWSAPAHPHPGRNITQDNLRRCRQIGHFDSVIRLSDAPVAGGIRLYELQKRAGDIPLWRDQIPELSIKAKKDGRYQRFYLVSRGTTVNPICGKAVWIPIDDYFTLPVGKEQFPLFIGEDEEAVGYSAKLESPCLPLKKELKCRLNMTFTYGADDPYELVFEPVDRSTPAIHVRWKMTEAEIITDAPAPEYPPITSWDGLRIFPKFETNETRDLLEWVTSGFKQLRPKLYCTPRKRETGIVDAAWREDKNGLHYSFALCKGKRVFLHENNFINGKSYLSFSQGDPISFELSEYQGKYSARNIEAEDYTEKSGSRKLDENGIRKTIYFIHKSLYFPTIQIWRDGRSIADAQCPDSFRTSMEEHIAFLDELLAEDFPPQIKNEFYFLLSCMHRDAPKACVSWMKQQVGNNRIVDKRAVGFGIGDLSEPWQKAIFDSLISNMANDSLRVFSYAIWRGPDFVNNFTLQQCQAVLKHLSQMLMNINPCPPRKSENDKWTARNWVRSTTEPLELLLGLLRTRASSTEDIRMLLQPHQKITKELANQVDRIADIFAKSPDVVLFSRVQLGNLPAKPEGDNTPDLLYALRLYLTGDDGANAIQITGVSDDDTD